MLRLRNWPLVLVAAAGVTFFFGSRPAPERGNLFAQTLAENGFRSLARYATEEDAVAAGQRKDLGSAVLEGPADVEVNTYGSWTLKFTMGRAGLKPGGGIRLAFAHTMFGDWGGFHLQATNPEAENYVSVTPRFRITPKPWRGGPGGPDETFRRYHPWQWITEFILEERPLQAGEIVSIRLERLRVQQRDETAFVFKLYVDADGNDDYLPLAHSPAIRIHGAAAETLVVNAPSSAVAGQPVALTVWLADKFANPASGFTGTVRLDSDDPQVRLPPPHKFGAPDRTRHRFEGIVFPRAGVYRLRAVEANGSLRQVSNPIEVLAGLPAER